MIISSRQNPLVQHVIRLHTPKGRSAYQECIVEGTRALQTACTHHKPRILVTTEKYDTTASTYAPDIPHYIVSPALMNAMSQAHTPSGVLGVFAIPVPTTNVSVLRFGAVLVDIADPGNMGTIIRTAAAVKADGIVVIDGCDPWSHKAIQASAGTCFALPILTLSWEEFIKQPRTVPLYALVVEGGDDSTQYTQTNGGLYMIGSEAHGLRDACKAISDHAVTIPMPGATESLNAAVAGSLALYLAYLQQK